MAKVVETCEVEVYVVVDSAGDYGVGRDEDEACEDYDSDIGGTSCRRIVKVKLTVPLPEAIVMTGVVPAEATEGTTLTVGGA